MIALPSRDALVGRRVLVVEDEALIALMLEDFLTQAGAIVIGLAASVAQALKLIEGEQVDVAVLDYAIADGVSVPVAEALIARSVPFLFASGHTSPVTTPTVPAVPRIEKPYAQVLRMLADLVQSR